MFRWIDVGRFVRLNERIRKRLEMFGLICWGEYAVVILRRRPATEKEDGDE